MRVPEQYIVNEMGDYTPEAEKILAQLTCPNYDHGYALKLAAEGKSIKEIDTALYEADNEKREEARLMDKDWYSRVDFDYTMNW